MTTRHADLDLTLALVERADALTMAAFTGEALAHRTKGDGTPVTDTDVAVEEALRALVAEHRPDDGFLGEEAGADTGRGAGRGRRWIVDPVDGTAHFMAGSPLWQTLIALEEDGELTVGASSAPAFGACWWGAAGIGSWGRMPGRDPHEQRASTTADLDGARWACYPDADHLPPRARALADALGTRAEEVPPIGWTTHPTFMVADGSLDLFIQPDGQPWDYAGTVAVVRAAGGDFCYLDGTRTMAEPAEPADPAPQPGLFSNRNLQTAALALLD